MIKISIIIPVYNTELYLRKCLDSIVNQTFENIELIIINDGSTDNSENIILDFKNNYSNKIKYFKTTNSGLSNARNLGVSKCSGDYFLFVDSDDFLNLDLLENLYKYLASSVDLIKYKLTLINETYNIHEKVDGPTFNITTGQNGFNKLCFMDKLLEPATLYLFNTNFYKNNNFYFAPNTYHEDFGLIPLVIINANTFISTNIYGYNYVQSANSIIRNNNIQKNIKKINDLFYHYDYMISIIKNYTLEQVTIDNIKLYYTNAILNAVLNLKNPEKKEYKKVFKKKKLLNNIKIKNIKHLIKKIYYKIFIGM